MKRKIMAVIVGSVLVVGILAGCGHKHEFSAATCTMPATCVECDATEGEALGHTWKEATCTAPKTCSVCNETEGEALEHTWEEATCTAPKTCSVCKETEGEALSHTLSEANYQQPATCSVCGETEGDVLTPAYVEYGVKGQFMELGQTYDYVTACYDNPDYKTVGQAVVTDYQTFASDDTHEAKEGYEWKIVKMQITFSDDNAWVYGWMSRVYNADYYDIIGFDDSTVLDDDGVGTFTVNWNGQDYTECKASVEASNSGWVDRTNTRTLVWEHLLPVGYDGIVIWSHDATYTKEEGMYIYDVADENTLHFRLQ